MIYSSLRKPIPQATQPITKDLPAQPHAFFCRPAEVVGQNLIGCWLVKLQEGGALLWGGIVETEAYSQDDTACHGFRRRRPQNETLFHERLPQKIKALSKRNTFDTSCFSSQDDHYRRNSSYLGKQINLELIALDPFRHRPVVQEKEKKSTHGYLSRVR